MPVVFYNYFQVDLKLPFRIPGHRYKLQSLLPLTHNLQIKVVSKMVEGMLVALIQIGVSSLSLRLYTWAFAASKFEV